MSLKFVVIVAIQIVLIDQPGSLFYEITLKWKYVYRSLHTTSNENTENAQILTILYVMLLLSQ